MNMRARNTMITKMTMYRRKGWSNLRCIKKVRTSADFKVEKIKAPVTEYSPRLVFVIPIDMNVNTTSARST
jgi:hypothetical protein